MDLSSSNLKYELFNMTLSVQISHWKKDRGVCVVFKIQCRIRCLFTWFSFTVSFLLFVTPNKLTQQGLRSPWLGISMHFTNNSAECCDKVGPTFFHIFEIWPRKPKEKTEEIRDTCLPQIKIIYWVTWQCSLTVYLGPQRAN